MQIYSIIANAQCICVYEYEFINLFVIDAKRFDILAYKLIINYISVMYKYHSYLNF